MKTRFTVGQTVYIKMAGLPQPDWVQAEILRNLTMSTFDDVHVGVWHVSRRGRGGGLYETVRATTDILTEEEHAAIVLAK